MLALKHRQMTTDFLVTYTRKNVSLVEVQKTVKFCLQDVSYSWNFPAYLPPVSQMKIQCYIQTPLKLKDILPEWLSSWWRQSGRSAGKFKSSWSDHRVQAQGFSFCLKYLKTVQALVCWAICYAELKSGVQPGYGYCKSYLLPVTLSALSSAGSGAYSENWRALMWVCLSGPGLHKV